VKKLIIVLSVLFVITAINQQLFAQKKNNPRSRDYRGDLKEQLNLSEDQEKKIETLRLSNEAIMIKFKSDHELKELEIRKLKSLDKLSRNEMINLTKEMNEIKNQIALTRTNHQMDVYDILDDSQRKIWLDKQEEFGHMRNRMKNKMWGKRNW